MSKIPTAEEYFKEYSNNTSLSEGHYDYLIDKEDFKIAMIKFAKLHVEAALKAASEAVFMDKYKEFNPMCDENSILNSYPLDKIK